MRFEPTVRRTKSLRTAGGQTMTEENYNYRTSQALLRNQFPGKGKLQIPIIPKFEAKPGDFDDLLLIGFDKTHLEDNNHLDRMVHFSSTITVLSEFGRIPTTTLRSCPGTGQFSHQTSVCIWKWLR